MTDPDIPYLPWTNPTWRDRLERFSSVKNLIIVLRNEFSDSSNLQPPLQSPAEESCIENASFMRLRFPHGMIPAAMIYIMPSLVQVCKCNPPSMNRRCSHGISECSFQNILVCAEVAEFSVDPNFQLCCYGGISFNLKLEGKVWKWRQYALPLPPDDVEDFIETDTVSGHI